MNAETLNIFIKGNVHPGFEVENKFNIISKHTSEKLAVVKVDAS